MAVATTTTTTTVSPGRLLTQVVIVIQMLLLTTCAFWYGLCEENDVICLPLMQSLPFLQGSTVTLAAIPESLLKTIPTQARTKQSRFRAIVTLQLEDEGTWTTWSSALQAWIQDSGFDNWPLWKSAPQTNVRIGGPLSDTSKSHPDTNATAVSVKVVEEIMASSTTGSKKEDILEIIVYVPKKAPLLVVNHKGQQSTAVTIDDNRFLSIVQHDDLTAADAITEALSYLMPFLETHGVPPDLEPWMERTALSYLQQAHTELGSTFDMLQSLSDKDVAITQEVADQWLRAVQAMETGQAYVESKQWNMSMELLELCLALLTAIRSDPSLIPPLHLPIEHCLAIFAPLLFPLLLPMVAGLVREYKRYKKLKAESVA
jgi:hypothetical protein